MNAQEIDDQLIQFKRREPFQPFAVELLDGRVIEIVEPNFAINGGASFLTDDDELVAFNTAEIRSIHPLLHEAAR